MPSHSEADAQRWTVILQMRYLRRHPQVSAEWVGRAWRVMAEADELLSGEAKAS